jgi:hypothetical protein
MTYLLESLEEIKAAVSVVCTGIIAKALCDKLKITSTSKINILDE